jgi:hypothetical protein
MVLKLEVEVYFVLHDQLLQGVNGDNVWFFKNVDLIDFLVNVKADGFDFIVGFKDSIFLSLISEVVRLMYDVDLLVVIWFKNNEPKVVLEN